MTVLASSVQDSPCLAAASLLWVGVSAMSSGLSGGLRDRNDPPRDLSRISLLILVERRDDHDGLGQGEIVGNGKIDLRLMPRWGDRLKPCQRAAREFHGGLAGRQVDHPHVAPEDPSAEAGAQ